MLKASHDAAMAKVDELSAQLRDERMKSLQLEEQLQSSNLTRIKMEQLQERISEVEQERDLLKESNDKLVDSAFDVSRQQRWQAQEQQLKLQIVQLETAMKADLIDKNEILDKLEAEREGTKKLHVQFLEQKQQVEELRERLKLHSKTEKSEKNGDLGFLTEVEEVEEGASTVLELRAAHAETIQELQKTRHLLSIESKICKDYKVELETVLKKMDRDKVEYEQKLERQAKLQDTRAAKIKKLEAQLRDVAYGTKTYVFRPDGSDEDEEDEFSETLHLERGENLLELQVVSATLSPSALEFLADDEPSTFCTYCCYLFELHSTPVVTGQKPRYGFTSKFVVSMDDRFLDYLRTSAVTVELHQALGLDWRTLATGRLRLHQLLEHDGKVHGTLPLVGTSDEARSFGSVDYWLRLRIPMTETIRLYKEKVKAAGFIHPGLHEADTQLQPPGSSSWNELSIAVQSCRALRSRRSEEPSPYVVYKFSDFPDYPTATVHDCRDPHFNDVKSYSVPMNEDLDQYLRSEVLQFYVFDYKEEQMHEYVGKARVPLLSLARDEGVTGAFELTDPSGLPAGHIEVKLKWKFAYLPPSGSVRAAEEPESLPKEEDRKPKQEDESVQEERKDRDTDETLQEDTFHPSISLPEVTASKAPLPKPRHNTQVKEGQAAKKVTFVDLTATDSKQVEDRSSAGVSAGRRQTSSPVVQFVSTPAAQNKEEEEDEEEESHFSDGQLLPAASASNSDSEISEIMEDVEPLPAAKQDPSESTQSDSDDCIVHGQTARRKASERIRVEILSLSLRPECRVARDGSVVRLFVEYSLLDLPREETPLSLPKPPRGKSINYNYSKVFPVDAEKNGPRRQLLRDVLRGRNPQMERIRFTVVSEPPEEEEQERECEDVGVAFLRIPEVLEKQQDLTETSLTVVDVEDSGEVVGSLTVSVEGLEALRAVMEDEERSPASSLLQSA